MSILLIIADRPNERQVAVERGLQLAEKLGCGAQVVGFTHANLGDLKLPGNGKRKAIEKQLLEARKQEVNAVVDKHKGNVHTAVTVVWEKSIHEWVCKQCARKEYIAVVKTGRRTETFLYTSTDWHLLRDCPAPVMIVAEKKWRATKPIMAAVDLSSKSPVDRELNDQVIKTAKAYAEALDTALYVVHALHIPAVLTELDLVDEYSHAKQMKEDLRPKLLKLSRAHDLPLRAFKLKQGPIEKVLTSEAARLKAQLVVMGTVGRTGVKGRLLGNTAEKVLDLLRTDVLAIKP